jgi:glutamyl-Q tRNA(Asp) synthetase
MSDTPYRGRFAPTPSGPLHFGSLIAAVGSYLEAKRHNGQWLLRIEDLDPPRVVAGAAAGIQRTLEAFGFEWDGPVVFQSQRSEAYRDALAQLEASGAVYPCTCSRREIQTVAQPGPAGPIYPGTCRGRVSAGAGRHSWRVNTQGVRIRFVDALQGLVEVELAQTIGDFVVRRADGIFAYHLALVVDDAAAGISHVVRGQDLLACTAPQIFLQQRLNLPTPHYLHLPVATNPSGQKLSKQTHARALDPAQGPHLLAQALRFLGHPPPPQVEAELSALWSWAGRHWNSVQIPRLSAAPSPIVD